MQLCLSTSGPAPVRASAFVYGAGRTAPFRSSALGKTTHSVQGLCRPLSCPRGDSCTLHVPHSDAAGLQGYRASGEICNQPTQPQCAAAFQPGFLACVSMRKGEMRFRSVHLHHLRFAAATGVMPLRAVVHWVLHPALTAPPTPGEGCAWPAPCWPARLRSQSSCGFSGRSRG